MVTDIIVGEICWYHCDPRLYYGLTFTNYVTTALMGYLVQLKICLYFNSDMVLKHNDVFKLWHSSVVLLLAGYFKSSLVAETVSRPFWNPAARPNHIKTQHHFHLRAETAVMHQWFDVKVWLFNKFLSQFRVSIHACSERKNSLTTSYNDATPRYVRLGLCYRLHLFHVNAR